ncbi:nectin-3-like protein [Heterodontus francisci]|uniref:nectin-3-like protein n=1 Tax=Heterodontus francisci TaxID=7792 RepID=UPI00355C3D35
MGAICGIVYFLALILPVHNAKELKVEAYTTGYVGMDVMLLCQLQNSQQDLKVVQVAWVKKTGSRKTLALYSPTFGINYPQQPGSHRFHFQSPSCHDATLVIRDLRMTDSGDYRCQFTTYPNGSISEDVTLEVLAVAVDKGRKHLLSTAVYVMVLLLLVTILIRLSKLWWKTGIQDVKSNPSQLQDDCQIQYAVINLHTSQTGERQTGHAPLKEVSDSKRTFIAPLQRQVYPFLGLETRTVHRCDLTKVLSNCSKTSLLLYSKPLTIKGQHTRIG